MSSNSDPEEPEVEDDELRVAAQHLTQDFLCHVIQEEEGRGKTGDDSKQEAGPQRQAAPLAVILGKLPSAASLGLQQTTEESETAENPDGKNRNTCVASPGAQIGDVVFISLLLFLVFSQMSSRRVESWIWTVLMIGRLIRSVQSSVH